MTKDKTRTGANPAQPDTPPPAVFDLAALLEAQLTEGLALLQHASGIAGNERDHYPRDRNGAMSAGARLMLANTRAAETLARFKDTGGKETIYRQIVEVKREPPVRESSPAKVRHDETDDERFAASRALYLSLRPPPEEVARHEALEAERIAEGRPIDENTWWLRRHSERIPFWDELEQSLADEGGGTPA